MMPNVYCVNSATVVRNPLLYTFRASQYSRPCYTISHPGGPRGDADFTLKAPPLTEIKLGRTRLACSGAGTFMSTRDDYRQNEFDCLRLARNATDPNEKAMFVRMAQTWARLAGQAATITSLVEHAVLRAAEY